MMLCTSGGGLMEDEEKPLKASPADVVNGQPMLSSFKRKAPTKYRLMLNLQSLRTDMVLRAIEFEQVYGCGFAHAKELMGASDMIHDWIRNIREDI